MFTFAKFSPVLLIGSIAFVLTASALPIAPGLNAGCLDNDCSSASDAVNADGECDPQLFLQMGDSTASAADFNCTKVQSASDHGLDMSALLSKDAAHCMVSSYSFVIPRGYHSNGEVDTNVCSSIHHANDAGFKVKDAYLFPCPTCSKSAATQVSELANFLNDNCPAHWSGRIWLDIEGSQYWSSSTSTNKNFYQNLVNSCKNKARCGVYSSSSQWSAIFGSTSYKYGNELPLWYAHYDGQASFSDFSSFGGWSKPHAKQYSGTSTVCSTGVDKNYSPSF